MATPAPVSEPRHWNLPSVCLAGLLILACFYTLYFARELLFPIVLAILLDFLLSPVIRSLRRLRIPEPLGAGLVILIGLGALGLASYELATPARQWVARAPHSVAQLQERLRAIRQPVEAVTRTAEQVEKATSMNGNTPEVVIRGPSLTKRLFGTTQSILGAALEIIILLYFLLASGDLFMQKLVHVLPAFHDKKRAVAIAREIEGSVSTYLVTILLVNGGLGVAVTIAMALHGMPNPALWGVLAMFAEFVPYLGATVLTVVFTLAGLLTFPNTTHALLIPATYLGLNLVQSQIVSPLVMGHRLTLNPVAIFVGIMFWWWVWGIPGAFLAVPLLATFKIFCDHIETLAPVGEFLGQ